MPKILASKLDFARDAYDKALKQVVSSIRSKVRKSSEASTEKMENFVKFLDESLPEWVVRTPDFSRVDFENSEYAQWIKVDWMDDKNKVRIWHNAYGLLRQIEKDTMASWRS